MDFLLRFLWYGDSTYDAWLNIVAAKLASRLLTIPQSVAQLGLPSAVVSLLSLTAMGLWTHSIINVLYLKYKQDTSRTQQISKQSWHMTQLHEVIGSLLGRRWKTVSMVFNLLTMFYVSSAQLIASSNVGYSLNNKLDKRTWTCVFGAIFTFSIFFPSAHNYRIWSFIGVVTIFFDSGYITMATLLHKKVPNVTHSSPTNYEEYFTGLVGLAIVGNVPIPVEIMDAMRKPKEYKKAYLYGMICIFLVVAIPSITMERKFGDKLLTTANALVLLPRSQFHQTASVLMLVHIFINFGMYSISVYAMWEKLLGVHDSPNYVKRTLSRLPMFFLFWLTALAFPFFGVVNKLVDAALVTWNFYIIPCAAYIAVFWPANQRHGSDGTKPFSGAGWAADFSVSLGIILWMLVVECGLGFWADLHTFLGLKGLKPFAKCYNC